MSPQQIEWRWDQGKLQFLRFPNVVGMARAFTDLDGLDLKQDQTILHDRLRHYTDQAFPVGDRGHTVWRQYPRTFRLSMLATDVGSKLTITDVCRCLAAESSSILADDYLTLFARRFALPSPAFKGFDSSGAFVFPIAAVLKLILAKSVLSHGFSVDAESALRFIKGNALTGLEPVEEYAELSQQNVERSDVRQVQEMLAFVSQFSWLDWSRGSLRLSDSITIDSVADYSSRITPDIVPVGLPKVQAFFALSSLEGQVPRAPDIRREVAEELFIEGSRTAATHLRIERSRRLRIALLGSLPTPATCQMCGMVPSSVYPWVDLLLEAHHLLPLASPLIRDREGTRLDDLAALCPSCHRSVHVFYRQYLTRLGIPDFSTAVEAREVYHQARHSVVRPSW